MAIIFLGLGSNMEGRYQYLQSAIQFLSQDIGFIQKVSPIYETAAWGKTDQAVFLNQVIAIESVYTPIQILSLTQAHEKSQGRVKKEKWGPRTIDIDLLFYGNRLIEQAKLSIPHPHIADRRFVLKPLSDIAPDFIHPISNVSIQKLLQVCKDKTEVKIWLRK